MERDTVKRSAIHQDVIGSAITGRVGKEQKRKKRKK
jgi:hypothetical protein